MDAAREEAGALCRHSAVRAIRCSAAVPDQEPYAGVVVPMPASPGPFTTIVGHRLQANGAAVLWVRGRADRCLWNKSGEEGGVHTVGSSDWNHPWGAAAGQTVAGRRAVGTKMEQGRGGAP